MPFLRGAGAMAARFRALRLGGSPVGPPSSWSPALKATLGLMLPAKAEIVLFWGPDYVALYNEAYAPTIGQKHPRALGRPARENWSELWSDLEPLLARVRETGETVSAKDRPFYIERHGVGETVYFDISYSAVREADGAIGGVLCIVAETTLRVLAQKQLASERERLAQLFQQTPSFMALLEGPTHVFTLANPAYSQLAGGPRLLGRPVGEALPEVAGQGFRRSARPRLCRPASPIAEARVDPLSCSVDAGNPKPATSISCSSRSKARRPVTGIFVEGGDVTEAVRASQDLRDSESAVPLLRAGDPASMFWTATPDGRLDWFNEQALV